MSGFAHPCPGCNCGCLVKSDNFNGREVLGDDWTEIVGGWAPTDGLFNPPDDGEVEWSAVSLPAVTATTGYTFEVECYHGTTSPGLKMRLIVDRVDSDNYHYAEINPMDSFGAVNLAIGKRVSGTDTPIIDCIFTNPGTDSVTITVCVTSNQIRARYGTESCLSTLGQPGWAGLQSGTSVGLKIVSGVSTSFFDNAKLYRFDPADDCDQCGNAAPCDPCEETIATRSVTSSSPWDLTPYQGPGIAPTGADYWRVIDITHCYPAAYPWEGAGCIDGSGELLGLPNSATSAFICPATYALQVGCVYNGTIHWPGSCQATSSASEFSC